MQSEEDLIQVDVIYHRLDSIVELSRPALVPSGKRLGIGTLTPLARIFELEPPLKPLSFPSNWQLDPSRFPRLQHHHPTDSKTKTRERRCSFARYQDLIRTRNVRGAEWLLSEPSLKVRGRSADLLHIFKQPHTEPHDYRCKTTSKNISANTGKQLSSIDLSPPGPSFPILYHQKNPQWVRTHGPHSFTRPLPFSNFTSLHPATVTL